MGKSNIEYLDWNITCVEGCTPISAGCDNCYAQGYLERFHKPKGVTLHPARLEQDMATLARIETPQVVGIAFTGDLFHAHVPDEFIAQIFDIMAFERWAHKHTFIILTKRPSRMSRFLSGRCAVPNVWLGVSVEDQKTADERIPILLQIPAAKHWLSIEPMLGPVELAPETHHSDCRFTLDRGDCDCDRGCDNAPPGEAWLQKLDWVVVGGESGPGARPMHPDWARRVRDYCRAAGVPFMFKQWGEWGKDWTFARTLNVNKDGRIEDPKTYPCISVARTGRDHWYSMYRVGKKKAGRLLDGVLHDDGLGAVE